MTDQGSLGNPESSTTFFSEAFLKILRISAKDTYILRQKMLRQNQPIENSHYENDFAENTFHLGAFVGGKLVSVASFYYQKNQAFLEEHQFRLRGMATLPEFQRQGLSKALLQTSFPIVKQNFCSLLWCNARTSASGFYQAVGFEKIGEEFEISGIGPHYLMYKPI